MTLRGSLIEGETEAENNPVEKTPDALKLDMQPPATEREITQRAKRDEKVAEWHLEVLAKPGVERIDWPDGVPVNAPSRSHIIASIPKGTRNR
eukprot:2046870-Amphidinium_carterae.1